MNQQLLSLMHFSPRAQLSELGDPDHHMPYTNVPGRQMEKGIGGTRAMNCSRPAVPLPLLLHNADDPGISAEAARKQWLKPSLLPSSV